MKTEAEFKKAFCDSVKKQGGYTLRLAAPIMNGLPDIYCSMPGYCPILLEAKFIKGLSGKFKRKIGYSKLQLSTLRNCWDVNSNTSYCLMGIEYEEVVYWNLLEPFLETINNDDFENFHALSGKEFHDIEGMFYRRGISTIR